MGALIFKRLFAPESVGIVSYFSSSLCRGNLFLKNLKTSNIKKIYKFDPSEGNFDLPESIDLLIITIPLKEIPEVLEKFDRVKIENVLITSGKNSIDDDFYEGLIIERLKRRNIKLIGFHSFGFISTSKNLNISLFYETPNRGELAFVSQSGALINTVLDFTKDRNIGFSYIIDLGTLAGMDFGDAIDFLAYQEDVKSILLFVESLKNPRKFLSAVRAVARVKPVIVVKAGKSDRAVEIIKYHTGKVPGRDFVYDIAFRRAGAVRVNDFTDMFICGDILSKRKIFYGENLFVISNSRAVNIVISDIVHEKGLKFAQVSDKLKEKFKNIVNSELAIFNPLELTLDATDDLIVKAIEEAFFSGEFHTVFVVLVLTKGVDAVDIIKRTKDFMERFRKCRLIYVCIGGSPSEREKIREIQRSEDILVFFNLFYAINSYQYAIKYYRSLEKQIAFTPSFDKSLSYKKEEVERIIEEHLKKDRIILSDSQSKQILSLYGIKVHPTYLVDDFNEAKKIVRDIGYPVVMKIDEFVRNVKGYKYINDDETLKVYFDNLKSLAPDSSKLNIQKMIFDIDFEFRIGIETDVEFGPYFYLSRKGGFDRVFMLPPLNRFLAQRLIAKFDELEKIDSTVKLEEILVRLSHLVSNHSEIYRVIIDPVIVSGKDFHIVNAFIELRESKVKAPQHLAIRPYPSEYEFRETLPDGTEIFIRPIRPEDEPLHIEFFYSLSRETQYYRFFTYTSRITHEQIAMFTHVDYDREIAIVAIIEEEGKQKIIGVNRLTYYPYEDKYEFAIVVTDKWQGKGVAKILMEKMFFIAKDRKIKKIYGTVLAENRRMLSFVKKFGFKIIGYESDVVYIMVEL